MTMQVYLLLKINAQSQIQLSLLRGLIRSKYPLQLNDQILKKFQNPLTYHSKLSRNLLAFPEASLLKISINAETKTFSQMNLSVQKSSQFTKKDKKDKNNYRPVSILFNISKLYERRMHQQINKYFESLLSEFQCGFR